MTPKKYQMPDTQFQISNLRPIWIRSGLDLVFDIWNLALVIGCAVCWILFATVAFAHEVRFEKLVLTDKYYCDGVNTADINGDGKKDVIAGPFWYEGPDFKQGHAFYEPKPLPPEPSPSNSMFSFVHDFSGDGLPDILVLGRVHKHEAKWYKNPGKSGGLWKSHVAFERVRGESPTMVDVDADGVPEILCHWEGRWGFISPKEKQPYDPWTFTPIGDNEDWPQFYHGQGVGDVNSDGRLDVVVNDGWYEQPLSHSTEWKFHRGKFSQQRGGAQMFVYDVNGDGRRDVISTKHSHEWGLAWYEQQTVGASARFREHTIMGTRDEIDEYGIAFTQPHALATADIDGDGLQDIVTGKRRWAHGPDGDIEPNAEPVVAWFRLVRSKSGVSYEPHVIDRASGVGVQIQATDVNQDGRPDILTASKLGTFVFLNRGPDSSVKSN